MDSKFTLLFPHQLTSKEHSFSMECQRCCQPMKFHSSFNDIDLTDKDSMSEVSIPFCQVNKNVHSKIGVIEATNDFLCVYELGNLPLDRSMKVTSKLFEIMSDETDVDHSLCEECTDELLDQMDQLLKTAEDECKEYKDFLENLQVNSNDENLEKLSKELEDLQEIEAQLEKELSAIEEKNKETKQLLKNMEDEYETLQREEDKQWKDLCRIQRQYLISEDNQRSVNNQLLHAQAQLDKLNKTNIFNATFHIWHSGHIGTINHLRLGRLPNVPVEWSEINAAWGQTVLLLHSLAKKMDFTFARYRLVPCGNHSYLEFLENESKDLPLYCVGGLRYTLDPKFDLAMVAFIDCLSQFKNYIEGIDESFKIPYQMENGKLAEKSPKSQFYSVKTRFTSEEEWTKALKYMLTNLKWALTWVSFQFEQNYDP